MSQEINSRKAGKKTNIFYWIFTGLFAFLMLGSAIPDILSVQAAVEGFQKMSMPAYLLPFLGIAKTLGVIAILIPGYPRIKEWAYAGLVFDLLGATYSIIASGQPAANCIFMALPLILAASSYIFYHRRIKASSVINSSEAFSQSNYNQNEKSKIANAIAI